MGVLGKKGVGQLPVYGELRLLHRQFAMSTKKAPINIKRGAIAEAELAIIQVMDSVSFASESASPVERLTLIRPYRRYARNKSYARFRQFAKESDASLLEGSVPPDAILPGINAYLGYLGKFQSRKMIESTLSGFNTLNTAFAFMRNYSRAIIKKQS